MNLSDSDLKNIKIIKNLQHKAEIKYIENVVKMQSNRELKGFL